MTDVRATGDRVKMLCLDEKTLPNLLERNKELPVVWEMEVLQKFMRIIERKKEQLSKEHLKYVMDLKERRGDKRE